MPHPSWANLPTESFQLDVTGKVGATVGIKRPAVNRSVNLSVERRALACCSRSPGLRHSLTRSLAPADRRIPHLSRDRRGVDELLDVMPRARRNTACSFLALSIWTFLVGATSPGLQLQPIARDTVGTVQLAAETCCYSRT